jgi:glycosyltransferase involved in cell wall biosynthesis
MPTARSTAIASRSASRSAARPTVAIDYTPAIRQQAGIGRLVRGQVDALIDQQPNLEIRLLVVGSITQEQQAQAPLPLHATPLTERNMVRLWHRLDLPYPRVEWFTGGPLDLFHATDFVLPPSRARRTLLTIHDLAFLFYPDAAMPSLHRYLNVVVPRSVRRADALIADSQHTATDLTEQWQVPPDRITVVQGAVDHERFRPITDAKRRQAVRQRYGLDERPYILALSRLEPRKNYVRLIEAFAQARQEGKLPHRLVIGGKQGWLYEPIYARVQELGLAEHVHFPGFIADEDLPALYSDAAFFAYPSLYEGFGLPIVEALACGAPVLAGDNSCLPEAGGPGAFYVDAGSTESIAEGIVQLACDRALAARLAAAGRTHALQFTWQRSAVPAAGGLSKVVIDN